MEIDRIYVDTCPRDIRQTYICLTSIRYWYPNIPITVLLDPQYPHFKAPEIALLWDCDICMPDSRYAGPWAKMHVLLAPAGERAMYVDSDIVFLGKVLDRLEQFDSDMIVVDERFSIDAIDEHFYNTEKLKAFDPDFLINRHSFNNGQFVLTTGLFSEIDFETVMEVSNGHAKKRYDFFAYNDQGLFNYVVQKKEQQDIMSLHREQFMIWGGSPRTPDIVISRIDKNSPYAYLVHWAGYYCSAGEVPNRHLLEHFENMYIEYICDRTTKTV